MAEQFPLTFPINFGEEPEEGVEAGAVQLSSSTPVAATVPVGATGVDFAKFVFNGNGSDALLNSLTLKRVGVGAASDFENVYIYQGNDRLTSGRSVGSSSNEVTFTNLGVTVPTAGSVTLTVVADIATGAASGNENAFQIPEQIRAAAPEFWELTIDS